MKLHENYYKNYIGVGVVATPQSAVEHSQSIEKHTLLKMFYVINEKNQHHYPRTIDYTSETPPSKTYYYLKEKQAT